MSKFYSLFNEIIVFFLQVVWYFTNAVSTGMECMFRNLLKLFQLSKLFCALCLNLGGPYRPCKLMLGAIALSLSSRCYPINCLSWGRFVMSDSETESSLIISEATNRGQRLPSKWLSKEPRIAVNHYLSSVRRTHRQKLFRNWSPRCSGPSKRTLIRQ